MTSKLEQVQRYATLYRGLDRARGVWRPDTGKMETVREAPEVKHFKEHLEGKMGTGVVPIQDGEKGLCWWGCIDVDAHEADWFIKIPDLAARVDELNLPLVVCQSKSMGAHCYLFLREQVPAALVQRVLKEWALLLKGVTKVRSHSTKAVLGPALVEIFPKQKVLKGEQLGNWVNLPYFDAKNTTRFAFSEGKKLSLSEFLDLAESRAVGMKELAGVKQSHMDAPPCVQQILTLGMGPGSRNNGLFAIGVYLRKSGCDDVEAELLAINTNPQVLERALGKQEVQTIARSVRNSSYGYRCNEDPICSMCDKEVCKTRKYGVGEGGPTKNYDNAIIGELKKILTDPPRWIIVVNEVTIELTTDQLMDYKQVRKAMLERSGIIGPPMKAEDWIIMLRAKNENREDITAPDDAGPGAMVKALLSEFCRSAEKAGSDGLPIMGKKEDLLRGLPIVARDEDTHETMVYFRGVDFIAMLKRKRAEEFKGAALWSILRQLGCSHDKVRAGTQTVQVWCKPYQPWNVTYEVPKPVERF